MERFKKIFAAGVIFVTVLSMSVVVAPQAGATASAGDLIKMSGLSSVYYLAADGKRYVFPNESTYFSWYSDFSGVVTIPQSELETYPLGANVTVRPGTKLVKITTNPKVYAVVAGGKLVGIPSEAVAATLFGANWNKRIIDVSDAFFTNYQTLTSVVSATSYPQGSLVKFGTSGDVFYINADTTASKIASEAAFLANRFKWADVITTTIAKPTEGAQISGAVATLLDTSSGAGGIITIGAGTGITVALASDTPVSATIITNTEATGNGQAYVPFLKVNFTAAADGDVKITNLKLRRTGISADADVESLYLYDGATRLTGEASVSSNVATFNNVAGLFTVTKGTTKSITLRGDMLYSATSGKTIGFSIVSATDVTTNGAAVSGSFPVTGSLMSTANTTDLGKLVVTATFPTTVKQTIDPDTKEAEVAKFQFVGSNQALSIERIVFTEIGSVQTDDLANFKLLDPSGTVIGTVASMNSNYEVIFDLSAAPYQMAKGVTKILSLRADVVKGSTRTFYFSIQNKSDIVVKDTSYNVYVEPYTGSAGFLVAGPSANVEFTINSGSLSIARATTAPSGNVTLDGTNVVVGEWDFRASGEDMKVKDLTVTANTNSYGGLDNGKIYVNGAQVGSTKDLTEDAGIITWGLGSSFVVLAGTTAKVQVLADIKTATSTSYADGTTVQVSVGTTASGVQQMSSLGYQAAITAVPGTTNALTITAAGLTVSKASGYGNQTIIAGTNNTKLGSFVVTAGSSEGINLSSITVTFLGALNSATVTNMYLKNSATGAIIGVAKNVPGTSNIYSLSPNIALAANGSMTIDLYADVKSSSNPGPWTAVINASGSGMVTGSSVSSTTADQAIQVMTVAGSGTLTATNGSMPDAAIVLAGSTGNYMAQYTFSATNEGFTISDLKLKTANDFATSTNQVTVKYTDKNGAAQQSSASFITGAQSSATATFTGLSIYVPANSDTSINVYVDMATLSSSGATHSGQTGTIILDNNEGFSATGDSGTDQAYAGASATSADLASNSFYNRKSKPTFAKLDAGTDPVNGALYKFSVVADNAGNIEIKQLSFTVATTECNVTSLYLYDTSASLALTDTARPITAVEGAAVAVIVGAPTPDSDVIIVGTTAKTYELRGAVTGYSAAGDQIVVGFKQDVNPIANTTALLAGANGTDAGADDHYNVWSDRSASSHTTATLDWTNGYLLKDMTQSQSFSK